MKVKVLMMLLMIVMLFSCSSDDDNGSNVASATGTWRLTSLLVESSLDLNGDGTSSRNIILESGCYQNETLVFNSDNTLTNNSNSYLDLNGTIDPVSGVFSYTTDCVSNSTTDNGTWSQTGASVSINVSGMNVGGVITGNLLTFVVLSGYQVPSENNGTVVTTNENLTFVYTKQ